MADIDDHTVSMKCNFIGRIIILNYFYTIVNVGINIVVE